MQLLVRANIYVNGRSIYHWFYNEFNPKFCWIYESFDFPILDQKLLLWRLLQLRSWVELNIIFHRVWNNHWANHKRCKWQKDWKKNLIPEKNAFRTLGKRSAIGKIKMANSYREIETFKYDRKLIMKRILYGSFWKYIKK